MTGAATAGGLLLAVLGFALAFLPSRIAVAGATSAVLAALAMRVLIPAPTAGVALAGCWLSLALAAFNVYWPALRRATWIGPAFAANSGAWAALAIGSDPQSTNGVSALLPEFAGLLAIVPARICIARSWTLAVRVVTSWLLAVAMLVGTIPYLVKHPGYVSDHSI